MRNSSIFSQFFNLILKYWIWRSWIANYRESYAYILTTPLLSPRDYSRVTSGTTSRYFAEKFRGRQMPAEGSDNHNHNILPIKKRKANDLVCVIILAEEAARIGEAKWKPLTKRSKSMRWWKWWSLVFVIQFRCLSKNFENDDKTLKSLTDEKCKRLTKSFVKNVSTAMMEAEMKKRFVKTLAEVDRNNEKCLLKIRYKSTKGCQARIQKFMMKRKLLIIVATKGMMSATIWCLQMLLSKCWSTEYEEAELLTTEKVMFIY